MVAQTEAAHGTISRRDGTVMHSGRMDTFWGWPQLSRPQGLRQHHGLKARCGLIHQHRVPQHLVRSGDPHQGHEDPA